MQWSNQLVEKDKLHFNLSLIRSGCNCKIIMFTNFRPQLYKFLIFHITTSHRQIPINILTIYNAKNIFYTKVYSATYIGTFLKRPLPSNYHIHKTKKLSSSHQTIGTTRQQQTSPRKIPKRILKSIKESRRTSILIVSKTFNAVLSSLLNRRRARERSVQPRFAAGRLFKGCFNYKQTNSDERSEELAGEEAASISMAD